MPTLGSMEEYIFTILHMGLLWLKKQKKGKIIAFQQKFVQIQSRSIVIHTEHAYNTKNMLVKRKSSGISSCPVKQPLAKIFMC